MTRLRADLLLLLTAIIWGAAFIAQKTGMDGLGPFGFVGLRFFLSTIVVLPLALREARNAPGLTRADMWQTAILCAVFFAGVMCQQIGVITSTVTNAGFLTGLYVVGVPFVSWLMFRRRPRWIIWPACVMAAAGVWCLNGAHLPALGAGAWWLLACAGFWSVQVALLGLLAQRTGRPLILAVLQFATCAALGLAMGFLSEGIPMAALQANWLPVCYAGLISGGIAYTLQAVAQQHAPPADAAIIMSGEALFAALAGFILLGERLDFLGWTGCALILAAMLLVETSLFIAGLFKGSAPLTS